MALSNYLAKGLSKPFTTSARVLSGEKLQPMSRAMAFLFLDLDPDSHKEKNRRKNPQKRIIENENAKSSVDRFIHTAIADQPPVSDEQVRGASGTTSL